RAVAAPEYPSRVVGCLLAGAIGDALGAGVEFDSLAAIRQRLGARGASGFVRAYGRVAAITDDTQMTLFTAEGLIRAHVRGREKGIVDEASVVWHAYDRWLLTQGETRARDGETDGWLVREQRLHATRAPGNTCLTALRGGRMGTRAAPVNDSKG